MPQSPASIHLHLIFSTKGREPLLGEAVRTGLHGFVAGLLKNEGRALVAAGGTADHVHLLVSLGRLISVADLMRGIKASSSRWVHETHPHLRGFAWQQGYGAFAVSYSNVERVRRYIEGQAEHHRVVSFQEEFRAFLRRHEIEYDERYLWE